MYLIISQTCLCKTFFVGCHRLKIYIKGDGQYVFSLSQFKLVFLQLLFLDSKWSEESTRFTLMFFLF